jgi:hypothetical protein
MTGDLDEGGSVWDGEALRFLASLPVNSRTLELSGHIVQARDGVLCLRQYVPVLLEALERFESEPASKIADRTRAARALDDETRAALRQEVDDYLAVVQARVETMDFDESAIEGLDEESALADPFAVLAKAVDFGPMFHVNLEVARLMLARSHDEQLYWWEYARVCQRDSHRHSLLRSQFLVAMNTIQPAVAALLLLVRRTEEDASKSPAPRPTLDHYVTQLLQRGPDGWRREIVKRLGMPQLNEAIDWESLANAWDRRDLFTHRGQLVDAGYLARHPEEGPIGSLVELTVDDVYSAFDLAGAVRVAFVFATAERVWPGSARFLAGSHGEFATEDLDKGRWRLAEGTARAAIAFTANEEDRRLARVNLWLALEGRLGHEAIRSEVEAWNTNGLPLRYELARLVLLRDDQSALVLIEDLLTAGEIDKADLATWPLFARLRQEGLIEPSG